MRATLHALRAVLLPALLLGASCYNPGDLGPQPFRCSSTNPDCPDNYVCVDLDATTTMCAVKNNRENINCICAIPCNTLDDCFSAPSATKCAKNICSY